MDIQPIVVGTAGHIDHGKSTLVQRLTGIDPDRWREEKERGMTIDLGFARFQLPDGRRVGIVDVPGHERFIRNMVAGASGVDLVILVVAADDGVMPQTREHLAILSLLGVQRGFVALTKIDAVDPETVELATLDVREAVEGTFLADAPILPVSSITGEGLDRLQALLAELAAGCEPRSAEGVFRMPVQRVFSARGFGTVLTGIPVSGSLRVGDAVEVLPGGRRGKVRGIQAYHESTDVARAGHSTALNLSDVDHREVARGDVVATPGYFQAVRMIGARLTALRTLDRPITNRMPVRIHTGTAEAVGEVVVLDVEAIEPGATALVQLRLERELVCAPGDPFVLRLASPALTLGGGRILEESRYRLKRFKGYVIDGLVRQERALGSLPERAEAFLAALPERWAPLEAVAHALKREREETLALLGRLADEGRLRSLGAGGRWIHADVLEESLAETVGAMETWFASNPMRSRMDVRDLRSALPIDPQLLAALLELGEERGLLAREAGGGLRLAGREVELDEADRSLLESVLATLREARFQPPEPAELAGRLGAGEARVLAVLRLGVDAGELVHAGGSLYLDRACIEEARAAIVENCQAHGQLEIPALRDRLGTTRKYLIPLLEYFDSAGVTLRQGGARVLKRR